METMTLQIMRKSLTRLPLCASLKLDYQPFQYFLNSGLEKGLEITSPTSLPNSCILKEADLVALHLPCKKGAAFYCQGIVDSVRFDSAKKEKVYQLNLIEEPSFAWPYYIDLESGLELVFDPQVDLAQQFVDSVKECLLLKKGVVVYLKHLEAYFSRSVGSHETNYPEFSHFFFDDIRGKLREKIHTLQAMHEDLIAKKSDGLFPNPVNFDDFNDLVQSEVNLDLFNLAFEEGTHIPYLLAIKELEENLYWHYNTLLWIYEFAVKEASKDLGARLQRKIDAVQSQAPVDNTR